jgi:predicted RND superfamily exporter protein
VYERIGRWILKNRLPILMLILALTGFFAWQMTKVRVESPTIDLFPSDHPYVETFVKYKDIFGGAGTVLVAVETKDGTIFNTETLKKVWRITKAIEQLPAVNNYQVLSLGQRKVKELKRDTERGFVATPLMWPAVPEDQAGLEALMERVYTSPRFFGSLVSYDSKAALIVAGFFEEKLDALDVYNQLDEIIEAERDSNTEVFMIGRPVMLGYILKQYPQIKSLLYYTIGAIFLVLVLYFRDFRGILLPMATATISAVWGLGFLGVMDYNFDPLVIVVPFIISARALSHSVQVVERFMEEFEDRKDRSVAAIRTFKGLFGPGIVAIITDAAGVFLVYTAPIPLLQKLAIMGGFWVLSIIISDLILNPILLSYLPAPKWSQKANKGVFHWALVKIGTWAFGWQRWLVLGITVAALVVGFLFARLLVIGDAYPGTPMLWPDSQYNQDTDRIAQRFGNTEIFSVIVEGTGRDSIKNAEVLRTMDAFQKHMEAIPEVTSTSSIADYLKGIVATLYHNDPKWEMIP